MPGTITTMGRRRTAITTITIDAPLSATLLTLLSWLSPVFPTGGFAYSAGLETAALEGRVPDIETLENRLNMQIECGAPWNDAVLLAAAYRAQADHAEIDGSTELAIALCGSSERLRETMDQGRAFRAAVAPWMSEGEKPPANGAPLPVSLGVAAARHGLPLKETVAAFLHAFVSAQLQAAIRLSITGQSGAAGALSRLEPAIEAVAGLAAKSTLDDLGTCTFTADIDTLRHETLSGRLFLS